MCIQLLTNLLANTNQSALNVLLLKYDSRSCKWFWVDIMDSFVAHSKFMFERSILVFELKWLHYMLICCIFVLSQYKFMNRLRSLLEVSGAKILTIDGFNLNSQV